MPNNEYNSNTSNGSAPDIYGVNVKRNSEKRAVANIITKLKEYAVKKSTDATNRKTYDQLVEENPLNKSYVLVKPGSPRKVIYKGLFIGQLTFENEYTGDPTSLRPPPSPSFIGRTVSLFSSPPPSDFYVEIPTKEELLKLCKTYEIKYNSTDTTSELQAINHLVTDTDYLSMKLAGITKDDKTKYTPNWNNNQYKAAATFYGINQSLSNYQQQVIQKVKKQKNSLLTGGTYMKKHNKSKRAKKTRKQKQTRRRK